jgi:hypothetical protein
LCLQNARKNAQKHVFNYHLFQDKVLDEDRPNCHHCGVDQELFSEGEHVSSPLKLVSIRFSALSRLFQAHTSEFVAASRKAR